MVIKTETITTSIANIFSYRKYWAKRFGIAPILPMSRAEMDKLGWDSCDIILVTGDAYVDHPSFGVALIGRVLEVQGFRVGIIAQPDWRSVAAFKSLGRPNLFFGVTSGNMDSMVNRYTADRKIRSDDAYTPDAKPHMRPDHATIVYAQRCREVYTNVPVVLGGIEASLRRAAHYDYWSDTVRRSILLDAKADILLYGNAERAIVDLAHRLARREKITDITALRGTAIVKNQLMQDLPSNWLRLPAYESVKSDKIAYTATSRTFYLEANPYNARTLVQAHGRRDVVINPPAWPLSTEELDKIYELPYSRKPHPLYGAAKIPAYEMIQCSVNIMRGCFGGCTFCAITAHEGKIIQSRSEGSILKEIESIRDNTPGFTGIISDLGGPTANMYGLNCSDAKCQASCRNFSCLYPKNCRNLNTDQKSLVKLYRKARALPGIKKILVASGVRYDLALQTPEYVRELVMQHVGGYLKIAPEHICAEPLAKMLKPGIEVYQKFKTLFDKFSQEVGKEQYLIPYFIAAHPGTTDEDMLELALWLKANNYRLAKVQTFLPTPMTLATTMYYTARDPLKPVVVTTHTSSSPGLTGGSKSKIKQQHTGFPVSTENDCEQLPIVNTYEKVFVPKKGKTRRLHKALLRYHDPKNWPLIRAALKRMGREDLIGYGKRHLVPPAKRR